MRTPLRRAMGIAYVHVYMSSGNPCPYNMQNPKSFDPRELSMCILDSGECLKILFIVRSKRIINVSSAPMIVIGAHCTAGPEIDLV